MYGIFFLGAWISANKQMCVRGLRARRCCRAITSNRALFNAIEF